MTFPVLSFKLYITYFVQFFNLFCKPYKVGDNKLTFLAIQPNYLLYLFTRCLFVDSIRYVN